MLFLKGHELQQIWRLYLNEWLQEYQKRIWPTFGSKVGQSVLIAMKLKLDVWRHLLDVYTKFEIDILKHVEKWKKDQKTSKKSKTRKNNRQNSENKSFAKNGSYVDNYTAGQQCTKSERFILI